MRPGSKAILTYLLSCRGPASTKVLLTRVEARELKKYKNMKMHKNNMTKDTESIGRVFQ